MEENYVKVSSGTETDIWERKSPDEVWIKLQRQKEEIEEERELDDRRKSLLDSIEKLQKSLDKIEEKYTQRLDPILKHIGSIEQQWINEFEGERQRELDWVTLRYRVTKSVKDYDKSEIVRWLVTNDKIEEGVSKLNLRYVRQLADVGILPEGAVRYEEKINLKVEPKGDTK